ncbi:hypothetical protein DXD25_02595 [Prevotella sp. TF12-30]|nr:hypothetical protein DXD25_02595 [Prevotella sp. TF12-30]RHC77599.1 hypothetical protein DW830_05815 [Prevotella sp. AM34-19LB]
MYLCIENLTKYAFFNAETPLFVKFKMEYCDMVSKLSKEHDRRSGLSHYLYGVSNLFISGTGIGGLSPMITGDEMGVFNYVCIIAGSLSAISFALFANNVMKYND